ARRRGKRRRWRPRRSTPVSTNAASRSPRVPAVAATRIGRSVGSPTPHPTRSTSSTAPPTTPLTTPSAGPCAPPPTNGRGGGGGIPRHRAAPGGVLQGQDRETRGHRTAGQSGGDPRRQHRGHSGDAGALRSRIPARPAPGRRERVDPQDPAGPVLADRAAGP